MRRALNQFIRVVKPGGTILISFQKKKNFFVNLLTYIANITNIRIFLALIDLISLLLYPFAFFFLGRKVSRDYLKYDVLLSLRNLHYGVPVNVPKKFRIKTAETEFSSEKTTATYKINVPKNKKILQ